MRFFLFILFTISLFFSASALVALPVADLLLESAALPESFILTAEPQYCDERGLFDMINGEAVIHVEYGFNESVFIEWEEEENSFSLKLELYKMKDESGAFGLLSLYSGNNPLSAWQDGLAAEGEGWLMFQKGKIFGSVIARPATAAGIELVSSLAKRVASLLPSVPGLPPTVEAGFKQGITGEQLQYFRGDTVLGERLPLSWQRPFDYKDGYVVKSSEVELFFFRLFDSATTEAIITADLQRLAASRNWLLLNQPIPGLED